LVIMFYAYIIYSESTDKYYIGHTHSLDLRLIRHNEGWTRMVVSYFWTVQ